MLTTHPIPAPGTAAAGAPRPAAVARGVVKVYGHGSTEVRALDGADLAVASGRLTAVMGPSGSGKSTLMHAMAGLDTVDAGSVRLGDTEMTTLSEKQRTPYEAKAAADKKRYEDEKAAYNSS